MEINVQTSVLTKALYRVQGIVDKKNTTPILSQVLLTASVEGLLSIHAADQEISLTGTYAADVISAGQATAPAKQFYDIIKSISEPVVRIKRAENHWIEIKTQSSQFRLIGMPSEDFPKPASYEHDPTVSLPVALFAKMIERTIFCVSTDDNRHNLGGIYCETPREHVLRMVATDGHRLAMAEGAVQVDFKIPAGVIVPRKGFQELKRILTDAHGVDTLSIHFLNRRCVVSIGPLTLSIRLIEGHFPNYAEVIPKAFLNSVHIARQAFTEGLKRVSLLSQSHVVRFEFTERSLQMIAEDPEFGEAREVIETNYTGPKLVIGLNVRYVLDALNLIQEPTIVFDVSDYLTPGIIKPLEDKSFLAMVMPMRI